MDEEKKTDDLTEWCNDIQFRAEEKGYDILMIASDENRKRFNWVTSSEDLIFNAGLAKVIGIKIAKQINEVLTNHEVNNG